MKTRKANRELKMKQMREYYDSHSIDEFISHYAVIFCEFLEKLRECETKCRRRSIDSFKLNSAEEGIRCLENILHANGIKPIRLLVRYIAASCIGCPDYSPFYNNDCPKGFECEGNFVEKVEEVALYCMNVDGDGFLQGITTEFKEASFEALEIIDANTGKTLWKGGQ